MKPLSTFQTERSLSPPKIIWWQIQTKILYKNLPRVIHLTLVKIDLGPSWQDLKSSDPTSPVIQKMMKAWKYYKNNKEKKLQKQLSAGTAAVCTSNGLIHYKEHNTTGKSPGLGHKRLYLKSQLYHLLVVAPGKWINPLIIPISSPIK